MYKNTRTLSGFCLLKIISVCTKPYRINYSLNIRHFSLSLKFFSRLFRPPAKYKKLKPAQVTEIENNNPLVVEEFDIILQKDIQRLRFGHQVFVIQPYIKWGVLKKRNTTPELQLNEAVTLIKTLREWKVVDHVIVSLQRFRDKAVFGSGTLENLAEKIRSNSKISGVFISINALKVPQQLQLEQIFGVPVFDRYSIIMHILKEHAQTKEAKLQVQLAQVLYMGKKLGGFSCAMKSKFENFGGFFGENVPRLLSHGKEFFKLKEAELRKEISLLRNQRALLRKKREKNEIPVVAVIGYTNAGKTSLVKALTGKKSLEPQDYLFATLDVTSHLGELPSGLKTHFIDTLGFISDIPTSLIESFVATLEDAASADVIIHVRDISHPDTVAQNDSVIEVLKNLNIPDITMKNVITVGNKIDLIDKKNWKYYDDMIYVSSTELIGIDFLRQKVEKKILQLTDNTQIIIRVKSGGPEYNWLYENATVVRETSDDNNNQFIFVQTIISSTNLAKFKHYFIKSYKR